MAECIDISKDCFINALARMCFQIPKAVLTCLRSVWGSTQDVRRPPSNVQHIAPPTKTFARAPGQASSQAPPTKTWFGETAVRAIADDSPPLSWGTNTNQDHCAYEAVWAQQLQNGSNPALPQRTNTNNRSAMRRTHNTKQEQTQLQIMERLSWVSGSMHRNCSKNILRL